MAGNADCVEGNGPVGMAGSAGGANETSSEGTEGTEGTEGIVGIEEAAGGKVLVLVVLVEGTAIVGVVAVVVNGLPVGIAPFGVLTV